MDKEIRENRFFKFLSVLCGFPAVAVMFLPRDFNPVWWGILVVISFVCCVSFCAFGNSFILRTQKKPFTQKLNLFNKTILFYNLGALFGSAIPIVLLITEKNDLSIANTLALLSIIIIFFRIFRIEIIENPIRER